MKAVFTAAARYQVTAVCQTPLRTGGTVRDTELILRNWQGLPIIQGNSLSGALRDWLSRSKMAGEVNNLFGSQERAGHLIVSDALFQSTAETTVRPRLHISGETGTADVGGKFDMSHICTGAKFSFTLTCLGGTEIAQEMEVIEQMLAALDLGDIRLGAQKTNGFGRVTLVVRRRIYDLKNTEDREDWLADRDSGEIICLPALPAEQFVTFTLRGQADSVLVKASVAEHSGSGSCTKNLQEAGIFVIPGSSVKGAVRARAKMIAGFKNLPSTLVDDIFGRMASDEDNGTAGKVQFEDVRLSPAKAKPISRIRIDRFTAGVVRGGLFTEEPVCSEVCLHIRISANHPAGCGLLIYSLRDLGLGLYGLGSGFSIGRGNISVQTITAEAPDGRKVVLSFDERRSCTAADSDGLLAEWLHELEVFA